MLQTVKHLRFSSFFAHFFRRSNSRRFWFPFWCYGANLFDKYDLLWLSIPFQLYSWPLTPVLNSLYQLFRANYLTQVMSLKGRLSKNVCVCMSARVSCQDCLPENSKSLSPRVSVKECLSILPRVSLQECLPKSVSPGMSPQECLKDCLESVSQGESFQRCLSRVSFQGCLSKSVSQGVSPRLSLRECFVENVSKSVSPKVPCQDWISRSVSPRVSPQECLSRSALPRVPKVSLPECLSKGVSPKVSLKECLSKNVSPRACLQGCLIKEVSCQECLLRSLSPRLSFKECIMVKSLFKSVSPRVSCQECPCKSLRKSVSARCFNMFVINIRVSIRARGLHLVFVTLNKPPSNK